MRAIRDKHGVTVGDVVTGNGKVGRYGGVGVNKRIKKLNVGTMVIALINARIDFGGGKPEFMPDYYESAKSKASS